MRGHPSKRFLYFRLVRRLAGEWSELVYDALDFVIVRESAPDALVLALDDHLRQSFTADASRERFCWAHSRPRNASGCGDVLFRGDWARASDRRKADYDYD